MLYPHITSPVVTVPSGTPIEVVAKTMEACEGRQLPVLYEGHPIGVVRQEDLDDAGTLRDGVWFAWGDARTARDVTSPAPVLHTNALEPALRSLLKDTVVIACRGDETLVGLLTEHDGVRIALAHLPGDVPALNVASKPVHSVDLGERACHADQLMRTHQIRHVVLTEDDRAVGMVSLRDLVAEGIRRGRSLPAAAVWKRRPLLSAPESATLIDVARVLVDERVGAVPILDASAVPVAMLTRRDVIRAALDHSWSA